jgi:ankyrin repeat protein
VLDLLVQFGVTIDPKNKWKETPLFQAASKGLIEAVRYLIDHGADVNCPNQ